MRDSGVRRHHRHQAEVYGRVHSIERVASVARCHLCVGAVLLARVPFTEGDGSYKPRPVVVVDAQGSTVVVRPCTSSASRFRSLDTVEIIDLGKAGLIKPTGVLARTVRIEHCDLLEVLGVISEADACRLFGMTATCDQAAA